MPSSPLDLMGWSGKSRKIRLKLDVIGEAEDPTDEFLDDQTFSRNFK